MKNKTPSTPPTFCLKFVPLLVLAACNAEEIEPDKIDPPATDTDSAGPPTPDEGIDGGTSQDDDGPRQRVCAVYDGEAGITEGVTVRWHCSGVNQGNVKLQLPPIDSIDPDIIDYIDDYGLDDQHNFGPHYGATWEDPAVIACCEDEFEYPNTPSAYEDDAEHAWACAVDCIDQTCRMVPDQLRELAEEYKGALKVAPVGCLVTDTPCYYSQITDLANYIAANQQACIEAFLEDRTPPMPIKSMEWAVNWISMRGLPRTTQERTLHGPQYRMLSLMARVASTGWTILDGLRLLALASHAPTATTIMMKIRSNQGTVVVSGALILSSCQRVRYRLTDRCIWAFKPTARPR